MASYTWRSRGSDLGQTLLQQVLYETEYLICLVVHQLQAHVSTDRSRAHAYHLFHGATPSYYLPYRSRARMHAPAYLAGHRSASPKGKEVRHCSSVLERNGGWVKMEVEKILGDDLDEILLSLILTLIITGFVFYLYLEREREERWVKMEGENFVWPR